MNFTATAHFSRDHANRDSSFLVYDTFHAHLRHKLSGLNSVLEEYTVLILINSQLFNPPPY